MVGRIITADDFFKAGKAWFKAVALRQRTPLLVCWNLTFRCNYKCRYCGSWRLQYPELETAEVMSIIDDLCRLGSRWITFSGGEPLLRDDIGQIIDYARSKGIHVFLSTNGSLVPDRIQEIRGVEKVTLSLEGSEEVHDRIRGEGSFRETEQAIGICQDHGLTVALQCTLTRHNLDSVNDVLSLAERFGIWTMFQPATEHLDSSTEANPIVAPPEGYRRTMATLIELKKDGALIANSLSGLKHLAKWPGPAQIPCSAGRYVCYVEPDGLMLACHQERFPLVGGGNREKGDTVSRFRNLGIPPSCRQCWCAPQVEINLIFALRPDAILNAIRTNR